MWKCHWAESKLSGYLPISVHLRFVFIHLCFPGRVLTRNPRAAADCCDERNTVFLRDRNISGVSRQFSLFQVRLNLVFYYLCMFDHKGFGVQHQRRWNPKFGFVLWTLCSTASLTLIPGLMIQSTSPQHQCVSVCCLCTYVQCRYTCVFYVLEDTPSLRSSCFWVL